MQVHAARAARHALLALATLAVIAGCDKTKAASTAATRQTADAMSAAAQQTPLASPTKATVAAPSPSPSATQSPTEKAITKAAEDGRYAFVLFYRPGESGGEQMRSTFDQAKSALRARAVFLTVDVNKGAEADLMGKYGVGRAPLPLTLALAPNGAVARAFTKPVDANALRAALVSPTTARALKALQDGKLVALCVQGSATGHNQESLAAAKGLADERSLRGAVEVIRVDPGDTAEASLLQKCSLSPTMQEATTVLVVPPNSLVATVKGATTSAKLLDALQKGLASCGCGPSGCG